MGPYQQHILRQNRECLSDLLKLHFEPNPGVDEFDDDSIISLLATIFTLKTMKKFEINWNSLEGTQQFQIVAFAFVLCDAWAQALSKLHDRAFSFSVHDIFGAFRKISKPPKELEKISIELLRGCSISRASSMFEKFPKLTLAVGTLALQLAQWAPDDGAAVWGQLENSFESYFAAWVEYPPAYEVD